jgi:aminoglycoside/choline kinase family phosphotransferase
VKRPLLSAPAFDGMNLSDALVQLYGALPEEATLEKLEGDASTRSYYRIQVARGVPESLIVMRLPADALKSDEGSGDERPTELPFLNVQRHLSERGVRVPKLLADHAVHGFLLLEDLGDETFGARLRKNPHERWEELYGRAVDLLAEMQVRCEAPDPRCLAYSRSFDRDLLRWELDHFREWGLEANGVSLSRAERALLDDNFDALVERLLSLPQGFVHRDFQSRNLMWASAKPDELVVIDFQDALLGPSIYDLVALLCDSYVDLDMSMQRAMIARLARARGRPSDELESAFWLVAAHRKLKDAGRFVFIDQVRGNPSFLPHFAQSMRYAGRAMSQIGELQGLASLLRARLPGFPDAVLQPAAHTGVHASRAL